MGKDKATTQCVKCGTTIDAGEWYYGPCHAERVREIVERR
jgi:hypothetical protein